MASAMSFGAVMRRLELPPVWLAGFMALAWLLDRHAPVLRFDGPAALWSGRALIALGIGVMVWSAWAFFRRRTTLIPRQAARALVTDGPYRWSRNPIYLADVFILIGWALTLGAASALLLAPIFAVVVDRRFIRGEEAMLRDAFPEAFAAWAARVRRWL